MLTPTVCVAPVRSHSHAMTISWLALAGRTRPAVAATTSIVPSSTAKPLRIASSFQWVSVRERPDPEVVPDVAPQPVQPIRLDDEEEDDQAAEQDQAEVRDDVEHRGRGEDEAAERLHGVADQDRQQRHEDRAEDRTEDRAEPADDDHRQVVDRRHDLELLVVRDAEVV